MAKISREEISQKDQQFELPQLSSKGINTSATGLYWPKVRKSS
jgi:hypothetical protein